MGRTVEEDGAECKRDDAESQLLQDGCAEGGVLAAQAELRLDQFFPRIEIFLHLAGKDLAELGIDAADVGGQSLDRGQQNQREDDERCHGRRAFAAGFGGRRFEGADALDSPRARSAPGAGRAARAAARSRRSICPESASWS